MSIDSRWRKASITFAAMASLAIPALQPGTQTTEPSVESEFPTKNRLAMDSTEAFSGETEIAYQVLQESPVPRYVVVEGYAGPQLLKVSHLDWGNLGSESLHLSLDQSGTGARYRSTYETTQQTVVNEIRRVSGLSWPRIAQLIGIERQTLFRWRQGLPADLDRVGRAEQVLEILNLARIEHGEGEAIREWLNRPAPSRGATPFELISSGRFDDARFVAMLAPSKVASRWSPVDRDNWYQRIRDESPFDD